jgi:hypothetical protein
MRICFLVVFFGPESMCLHFVLLMSEQKLWEGVYTTVASVFFLLFALFGAVAPFDLDSEFFVADVYLAWNTNKE